MVIFATIFGVGFLVLILSLLFGGDSDVDTHVDVDHGVDHGFDHGPSIFSTKIIALLMVGFGGGGFGMRATSDASMLQASMAGLIGAALLGAAGYFILNMFYSSQASSTIQDDQVVGATAQLIDGIGENANGQVACVVRGREITFLARSADGRPIKRGTTVKIVRKTGNLVIVSPVES